MLDDPTARAIISRAKQKNVAQPRRSARDFERILDDFFGGVAFEGRRVLDLGPGQYDFARLVGERGGACEAIDKDPAVLELGAYLGLTVHAGNLKRFDWPSLTGGYDGLFCKYSLNAYWHGSADRLRASIASMDGVLAPGGWGWIAPWNGRPAALDDDDLARALLAAQGEAFASCGWTTIELPPKWYKRYGMEGRVDNHPLFLKNLDPPKGLRR